MKYAAWTFRILIVIGFDGYRASAEGVTIRDDVVKRHGRAKWLRRLNAGNRHYFYMLMRIIIHRFVACCAEATHVRPAIIIRRLKSSPDKIFVGFLFALDRSDARVFLIFAINCLPETALRADNISSINSDAFGDQFQRVCVIFPEVFERGETLYGGVSMKRHPSGEWLYYFQHRVVIFTTRSQNGSGQPANNIAR